MDNLEKFSKSVGNNNSVDRAFEVCNPDICILTKYDVNIAWIECGKGGKKKTHWCHVICECLSNIDALQYSNTNKVYSCLQCNKTMDRDNLIYTKIDCVNEKIEQLTHEEQILIADHDNKKMISIQAMGDHEKALNMALKNMNVVHVKHITATLLLGIIVKLCYIVTVSFASVFTIPIIMRNS